MVPSETEKTCDESRHGKIQCRIVATQKRLKLEASWAGYWHNVEEYVKTCPRCKKKKKKLYTK